MIETHPVSKVEIEVFWAPRQPELELLCTYKYGVDWKQDLMPHPCYNNQPDHTFQHCLLAISYAWKVGCQCQMSRRRIASTHEERIW